MAAFENQEVAVTHPRTCSASDDGWGEPISSYSRAMALEDGELVDASKLAKDAGFVYPVALTRAAWATVVEVSEPERAIGQDETGRLWDVVYMAFLAIRRSKGRGESALGFSVLVQRHAGAPAEHALRLVCGPGDDKKPVITIMLPDED